MDAVDPVIIEQLGHDHPLARHLDDFLTDLKNAGKSPHTVRGYRSRWDGCCQAAGVEIDIHQLRHAHATELIKPTTKIVPGGTRTWPAVLLHVAASHRLDGHRPR
ncbi:hypothetical protein [Nonomuraea sp. NPDC049158]|uniref:hypothetical protein n=1 Tax=Nonomuraea sp. NPDC049158 TaxID=3155649 RepID=UPI003404BF93